MPPELKDYEESSLHERTAPPLTLMPVAKPQRGALAALMQEFCDEDARRTPEEIAAEDAAFAKMNLTRLSLPVPDVFAHD